MIRQYEKICLAGINYMTSEKEDHIELAVKAVHQLIQRKHIGKDEIGVLIYVTQTPKFMTPSTTFYIHKMLSLGTECFQFDVNQGGSGFITGIQLVISLLQGFLENKKAILINGDNNITIEDNKVGNAVSVSLYETDCDAKIYIGSRSGGEHYKAYYQKDTCLEKQNYREWQIHGQKELWDEFNTANNLFSGQEQLIFNVNKAELDQIISEALIPKSYVYEEHESSVQLPIFLIKNRLKGHLYISSFGAGLSAAGMLLNIKDNVYED